MRIVGYAKGGTDGYDCQREDGTNRCHGDPLAGRIGPLPLPCRGVGRRGSQHPLLFMRMPSSVQRPRGPIVQLRPLRSDEVDNDRELAVVIGLRCRTSHEPRPAEVVGGG